MVFKRSVWLTASCLILLFSISNSYAQITGDYRSIGDANWDVDANWVRWNGASWVAPGANGYPGETPVLPNTTVTIIENDNVTLNVTVSIVNLTIESGTLFDPTELDTSGNPTLTISGSLTKGVTGGGLRAFFTFSGTGNLAIGGNLIDQGGPSIFSTSTFTFSSSGLMSVGVNLSISNQNTFTISGTGALTVGGSITTQGAGQTATLTFSTSGNVTVSGNTTILTGSSITDSNDTGVSTFTGRVSNSGTWTSSSVITPARMIFRGGITNTAPGVFSAGAGTFNLNDQTLVGDGNISFLQAVNITGVTLDNTNTGSFSVAGTTTLATSGGFTDSSNNGLTIFAGNVVVGAGTSFISIAVISTANMIFRGGIANSNVFTAGGATFNTNNQAITGASSLSFANNVEITGITVTNSNTANLTISGTTTLGTSGGFTDSDNTGITTLVGNVSVNAGTSFISTAVTTTGNLVFRGGIANSNLFTAGGATFNTNPQTLTGAGTMSFAQIVTVTGIVVTNNTTVSLTNTSAATLTGTGTWTQGTGTLNFAGSTLTVNTFDASTVGNTVNYNSTLAQTIRTPATNYNILTLNNTFATIPSLTTTGNITVINTLNFNNGIVNLSGFTFTLGTSGAASILTRTASTTTNWMYGGSFRRFWPTGQTPSPSAGNLYGLFPLGHSIASSYRPVQITAGSNITTTGSVTFNHVDASSSTDLSPFYDDDPTAGVINIVRKHNSQFIGSTSLITGGTNYTIVITMTNLLAGTASNIRLAVSNGATTVTNVGSHVANTGTAPIPVVGRSGLTVANLTGDFRITSINSVATPLPVELISFDASLIRDQVNLSWVTASELNNDFFTIERASDVEKFEEVAIVKGQGTTNVTTRYTSIDESPSPGVSYYRLKQTDFDGKFSYSDVRVIENNNPISTFKAYPNPIAGNKFTLEMNRLPRNIEVPVAIVNMQGAILHQATYRSDTGGNLKTTVEMNSVPSGVYMVVINAATGLRKKIVVP